MTTDAIPDPKEKAKATYASDSFDHPALAFWDRYGRATIERLALLPGA